MLSVEALQHGVAYSVLHYPCHDTVFTIKHAFGLAVLCFIVIIEY